MGETLKKRLKQQRFESTLQEAMLNVLVAADHIREILEALCAPHGITLTQYNVLRILRGAAPGGHPRCEIISRMIHHAPDVTRLIDRLEEQGLVERSRSGQDRRMSITRITARGMEILERMNPEGEFRKLFAKRISSRDQQELSRICEKLYGRNGD